MAAGAHSRLKWLALTEALVIGLGLPQPAVAKARGSIALTIVRGSVEAAVLAEWPELSAPHFIIKKAYFGSLTTGSRIPLGQEENRKYLRRFSGQPRHFVLFLYRLPPGQEEGWNQLGDGWAFEPMTSLPIAREWHYVSMIVPQAEPGGADQLPEVEKLIARGLDWKRRLDSARKEPDPRKKLELLRPLFLLPAEDFDGHYDLFGLMGHTLAEVETTGPTAIPFLEGLLRMPHFQKGYRGGGWENFGEMTRARIEHALDRVRAQTGSPSR